MIFSRHTVPNALRSLFRAGGQLVRGPITVPRSIWFQRQIACIQCPQNDGSQCRVCTCFIAIKTEVATESCPLGKWGKATRPYRVLQYAKGTVQIFYGYTLDRLTAWAKEPNR